MHCIKSQQSKLDSCFFLCATLGRLGFWQLFGPHWHERLESLSRWKPGCPSWHFTKQIRQEVLTIRNDIADPSCICLRQTTSCACPVSTQQHGRLHTIFVTTPLHHHFPSSPLPFVTTSLRHHFPSSPLPFVTTSLRHHFPSSPLPFVTTSLRHHFPSSPPVIITTLHQSQFHCFLFFSYVLLCYVLLDDLPPFIISSRRILFVRNTEVLLPNFLC